ncbi:hypothetical protein BC937DRAFT_88310 [Endogone sp. FLAS-F59071]|nr:hypothetical protein BC937DRAFT_88310 [Endogone sp. FLAS-F59071]|eukprot:RUS18812.1 hypothetical protein BC937DRAFT_88310 [Endogone sp. FLAS-F59071]
MDSVDNTVDLEAPQTLAPQPKPALSLLPTELWTDIIDQLDIDSLCAARQTCVALSTLVRPRLIEQLVLNPPLGDLCRGAKTRAWADWDRRLFETGCLLRRQLARLWAADARFFPFTHAQNKEWKRRREARGCVSHPVITSVPATTHLRSSHRSVIPASTDSRLARLTDAYPTVTPDYYFRSTTKTPNQGFPTSHADIVKRFSIDPGTKVLVFPPSLTSYQRRELHRVTWFLKAGLKSESMGEGSGRSQPSGSNIHYSLQFYAKVLEQASLTNN